MPNKTDSTKIIADLVRAYEREVRPATYWQDTALTAEEFDIATKEYRSALEWLANAQEITEPAISLDQLEQAVNAECSCGGGGPNDKHTCQACMVYHRLVKASTTQNEVQHE